MTNEDGKLLTDAELELMQVLWARGGGTVREVMADLPPDRSPAYTTVSTVLRILVAKGFVRSEKVGRSHRYAPNEPREGYEARTLRHVIGGLFGGNALSLMRRLVSTESIPEAELRQMQRVLDERLGRDEHES